MIRAERALRRALALFAPALLGLALPLVLTLALSGCGGQDMQIGVAASPPPSQNDEWPQLVAQSPPDAVGVKSALECADGAQIRVRAYLVAIAAPCPACNVGARSKREDLPGRTSRPTAINPTGCLPCPDPVATISDELPTASAGPKSPPLRAVGVASGLQPRHVGHLFLLTGTFHARAENGPELDVTDVRALDGR